MNSAARSNGKSRSWLFFAIFLLVPMRRMEPPHGCVASDQPKSLFPDRALPKPPSLLVIDFGRLMVE
jgi:hypothetical protein